MAATGPAPRAAARVGGETGPGRGTIAIPNFAAVDKISRPFMERSRSLKTFRFLKHFGPIHLAKGHAGDD